MLRRIRTASLGIAYEEIRLAGGPPVVLLHGLPDDVRAHDGVAARLPPRCRRHLVPGVGHNLPQEAPDAFAAAVTALL